jgi:hypothetical protein
MLLRSESMNGAYQVVFLVISHQSSLPLRANVDVTLANSHLKADYQVERGSCTLKQINVVFHSPSPLLIRSVQVFYLVTYINTYSLYRSCLQWHYTNQFEGRRTFQKTDDIMPEDQIS